MGGVSRMPGVLEEPGSSIWLLILVVVVVVVVVLKWELISAPLLGCDTKCHNARESAL